MLRFSRSDDQLPYSRNNLPPNPPLTTILEQCFWSDSPSKFFYINKYNSRCASRNSPKIDEKYERKPRPATARGRFCSFEERDRRKSFSCFNCSDDSDDDKMNGNSSRSSTPDFMHEVYETYSDLNSVNLLLRRPVSRCDNNTRDSVSTLKDKIGDSLFNDMKIEKDAKLRNVDGNFTETVQHRKTVTVDIPMCNELSETDDPLISLPITSLITRPDVKTDFSIEEEDDGRTSSMSRGVDNNKSHSPTKKKIKRKKVPKKKIEASNITSDTSRNKTSHTVDQTNKSDDRNKYDDIVTQMSALGLSRRLDEELTPVLLRKLPAPKSSKPRNLLPDTICRRRIKKLPLSAPPVSSMTPKFNHISSARRRRRMIPIQIVSDPFKCPAINKEEKSIRPHTVHSLSSSRSADEHKKDKSACDSALLR